MERLKLLAQRLVAFNVGAATTPGVHIAWLESDGLFYLALQTYSGAFGKGKTNIFSTKQATLADCVEEALAFLPQ